MSDEFRSTIFLGIHPSARKHGISEADEKLSKDAEAGDDVDEILRRRRGRPPIGSGPATVESVRLDPELRQALAQRAQGDNEATSLVIRKALRRYLQVG